MGTEKFTPKIHKRLFATTCLLFKLPGRLSVARKRAFNSTKMTNGDQVFLRTKVCPHHITQVVLKVVRASEG